MHDALLEIIANCRGRCEACPEECPDYARVGDATTVKYDRAWGGCWGMGPDLDGEAESAT